MNRKRKSEASEEVKANGKKGRSSRQLLSVDFSDSESNSDSGSGDDWDPLTVPGTSKGMTVEPAVSVKTEDVFAIPGLQPLPFDKHLESIKSVLTQGDVSSDVADRLLKVLHKHDPRYPEPKPPAPNNLDSKDIEQLEQNMKIYFKKMVEPINAKIEQVQSTVNRIVRLIEVLKPGSTELVAGEAPLRFPLPPADMERLETADPSSHLRQVFVQALIDRTGHPKSKQIKYLISGEAMDLYNWTGKNKKSCRDSQIFQLLNVHWFNNDLANLEAFIKEQWRKRSARVSRARCIQMIRDGPPDSP